MHTCACNIGGHQRIYAGMLATVVMGMSGHEFMRIWEELNEVVEEAGRRARALAERVARVIRERYWDRVVEAVSPFSSDYELAVELSGDSPILYVPCLIVRGAFEDPDAVAERIYARLGEWGSHARLRVVILPPAARGLAGT